MRESLGLLTDVRMAAHHLIELRGETHTRGFAQSGRLLQELLGLLPKCGDRGAKLQELLFSVAHQFHKDVPLPSALAAKTTPHLLELLGEVSGLALERGSPVAALRGDVGDELECFFCALYSVVASVTR